MTRRCSNATMVATVAVLCASPMALAQDPCEWLEAHCPADFDVAGTVVLPARAARGAKAKIVLNYVRKESHLAVAFTGGELKGVRVTDGKAVPLWKSRALPGGPEHAFILKRRANRIAMVVDGRLVGEAPLDVPAVGRLGTSVEGDAELTEVRYQEVAPVHFTDDFMRTADQPGAWETVTGEWKPKPAESVEQDATRSANPFSYGVAAKEQALAVAGYWFWDSYLYKAAVRPESSGTVGLVFFYQDPQNYGLFRWHSSGAEASKAQELVWVEEGNEHVVASTGAGYQPRQWYDLTLKATDSRVEAFVDGKSVLAAEAPRFCSGKIGLYARDCEYASFDDAFCRHWEGPADDPSPFLDAPKITARFTQEDTMSDWADADSDWLTGEDNWSWNRGVFWGDAALSVEMPFIEERGGHATLAIHASGGDPLSGYALRLVPSPDGKTVACTLSRQGKQLGAKQVPPGDWPLPVELRRHEGTLLVTLNGERLLAVRDPKPLPGTRTAIQTVGMAIPAESAFATGTQYLDDTFATAPTRWWQGKGKWHVTNRWTCQPGWTWMAGTESETPILWTKKAFAGDFAVEAFLASKMDLTGGPGYSHPGDLNVTVCADGRSLGSGYSCLYGGWNYTASGMFRKDAECTERSAEALVDRATSGNNNYHRHWFRVRVEREGNTIRHFVDDTLLNEFTDPDPIPAGRVALWGFGNERFNGGVMVARARIWYEREAKADAFPAVPQFDDDESGPWSDPLEKVAPAVTEVKHDFETDLAEWSGYDRPDGAMVSLDDTTAATGKRSLKVTNPSSGGDFTVWAGVGPFDARKLGKLRFAYKIPPEVKVNLYVQTRRSTYYAIEMTGGPQPPAICKTIGSIADLQADNQWHTAEFDLAAALKDAGPKDKPLTVNQLCFSAPKDTYFRAGIGGNGWGASYHLDDFELSE